MRSKTAAENLQNALARVESYILRHRFRGFDPYDALSSPLFQLPGVRSNRAARLIAQQIVKRSAINIRPLLAIKSGLNPVTLGLCIQAFAYLSQCHPQRSSFYLESIDSCISELERLKSTGYHGACWGYDFDWEGRHTNIAGYTPTIVATGIISNALFECHRITGNKGALALCLSATEFVRLDLNRTLDGKDFCYSYSPSDRQVVFNATMKGARLLGQVSSVYEDKTMLEEALRTVNFVVKHQRVDGSWPYAYGDRRDWVDNFHTGYVLDCLGEFINVANAHQFEDSLARGLKFYSENFIYDGCVPKYYSNSVYPIDSTAAAQSILTFVRFGNVEQAQKIAAWMIETMQDSLGYFYYQKHRMYTNKIAYMRWSNAWMYVALSFLLFKTYDMV